MRESKLKVRAPRVMGRERDGSLCLPKAKHQPDLKAPNAHAAPPCVLQLLFSPPCHNRSTFADMYCQKCRTPVKLDGSLEDLNPAAFKLLTGMSAGTWLTASC